MAATGLLVVSNVKQIGATVRAIEKYVSSLYVHINIPATVKNPSVPAWAPIISKLYVDSSHFSGLDIRILVGHLKKHPAADLQLRQVDQIFCDSNLPELCETLRNQLKIPTKPIYLNTSDSVEDTHLADEGVIPKVYDTVVLGGTFDRIHLGHKIFLTQAVLRACRRLVVGVTTAQMSKSKTLAELILPVEQRICDVRNFLKEIDSSIQYDVVPIDDPFGPTKSDPDMDLIVVSCETLRGGHKVNEIRAKQNLRPLEIFCVNMVEDLVVDGPKESKVSSTNTRIDLLGTRLRQPESHLPSQPYIIGLTGGIASGKSKMAQRFESMGAIVLDCDKIAHELYLPNQVCFDKIVQHFGKDVVHVNGNIDRQKLGAIVFSDGKQLEALNAIVWPEIILEVKRRIKALATQTNQAVVVIEAAVLFKAGWETECHEVWSMIVPPEEAIRRIVQRNNLTEEEARRRLDSQLNNTEIVARSNIVFSSQWDEAFTQQQAERAWKLLMSDLERKNPQSQKN